MASLQARHTRACTLAKPWTPFEIPPDCDCQPTYYVAVREGTRLHRERVGKNRKHAERALRKIGTAVDDGAYQPQLRIPFADWAQHWLSSLETKPTTLKSYTSTINYATRGVPQGAGAARVAGFGDRDVRQIHAAAIGAFNAALRGAGLSDSTRAKHLRVLNACFEAAQAHGYTADNPVRRLPRAQRPRAAKKEAAYFEDAELGPLVAQVTPGVFRTLILTALKTGMRQGELAALTWADVDLADAVIRVRRSITDGHLGTPKNHERRDVDITRDLVDLLGAWWGQSDTPQEHHLVFPGDGRDGHLVSSTILNRELYPAMHRAGIPRQGPTDALRTFHSLRHTYARIALEHGAELTWLQRQLGHSNLAVTANIYGHWSRHQRKAHAERMEGAFTV
jgi:integrase